MHELALLESVVSSVLKNSPNNLKSIDEVHLEYGILSGINKECLEFAWPEATKGTVLENSLLKITRLDSVLLCKTCLKQSKCEESIPVCSLCASQNVTVISGGDLILRKLNGKLKL